MLKRGFAVQTVQTLTSPNGRIQVKHEGIASPCRKPARWSEKLALSRTSDVNPVTNGSMTGIKGHDCIAAIANLGNQAKSNAKTVKKLQATTTTWSA